MDDDPLLPLLHNTTRSGQPLCRTKQGYRDVLFLDLSCQRPNNKRVQSTSSTIRWRCSSATNPTRTSTRLAHPVSGDDAFSSRTLGRIQSIVSLFLPTAELETHKSVDRARLLLWLADLSSYTDRPNWFVVDRFASPTNDGT
jgi:hypothetical protein